MFQRRSAQGLRIQGSGVEVRGIIWRGHGVDTIDDWWPFYDCDNMNHLH